MKRVEILSHPIQYRDEGKGSIVILVHGYGGTIYDWDEVLEILSKKYRVIVPNLSSIYMDPLRAVSFSQQVTVFKEFVKLFKKSPEDKIYLVGGSYGGSISYGLAIEDSSLIKRLALLNPMPPAPKNYLKNPALKVLLDVAKFPPAIIALLKSPFGRILLKYIQNIFHVSWIKSTANKHRLDRITKRKAKLIAHVVHRFDWISSVENWSIWEDRLGYLTTPVHILWGTRDTLFVESIYEDMSRKFPHCEVSRIEGGRHLLMKDRPEEVSKILDRFFSSKEKDLDIVYSDVEYKFPDLKHE